MNAPVPSLPSSLRPVTAWVRPRRRALGAAAAAALSLALALPAGAREASRSVGRVDLPPGWRPEGVTTDGSVLFVGSLADGAIYRADPGTGDGEVLVDGSGGSVAVGIDIDPYGRLWVAGGPTGEIRAHDATSGELLGTYAVDAGFVNDVVATEHGAFITDSFRPQLVVVPFGDRGALPEAADEGDTAELRVRALPLRGIEYANGAFNANGIVAAGGWLVLVQSVTGSLYRVDPASGQAFAIDTPGADLRSGDGLELVGRTLYVMRNAADRVAVVELRPWLAAATLRDEMTADELDTPTTGALVGDHLWVVNARFGTEAGARTAYWLTGLPVGEGGTASD